MMRIARLLLYRGVSLSETHLDKDPPPCSYRTNYLHKKIKDSYPTRLLLYGGGEGVIPNRDPPGQSVGVSDPSSLICMGAHKASASRSHFEHQATSGKPAIWALPQSPLRRLALSALFTIVTTSYQTTCIASRIDLK